MECACITYQSFTFEEVDSERIRKLPRLSRKIAKKLVFTFQFVFKNTIQPMFLSVTMRYAR